MNVFALHPLRPRPLGHHLFTLALAGFGASSLGRRRAACAFFAGATVLFAAALARRGPVPDTLAEVRANPGLAFVCSLAAPR